MKSRVLVVEDEPSILDNVVYSLETEGFEVRGCGTGEEALRWMEAESYDLVILDIGLPDVSGFRLCGELRRRREVPLIFLTARSAEVDRVVGLEIGADDYVVKPFSPRELSARARAVLRRYRSGGGPEPAGGDGGEVWVMGPFRVDEGRVQIRYQGELLGLSSTEYRLLRALCRSPGRVYTRQQLMDAAWSEPEASMERTVDAHIKSIRSKLRQVKAGVDPILTHRGMGYALREDW